MKPSLTAPVAAEVRQEEQSEAAMIQEAKQVISTSSWKLGEIACRWTAAYARGRTDADLGAALGMTGDQVYQRRRVWERFSGISDTYRNLSWSHFYAALTWDDAEACLDWACENYATVAEMKAWRTAAHSNTESSDTYRNQGTDDDPFGEGASGAGTDSGKEAGGAGGEEDGTETEGTETEESGGSPKPPRRPRSGKEKPEGDSSKDPVATQRAKAVKTWEAASRAISDLNDLQPIPQHDAIVKSVSKVIATLKGIQQ